MPAPMKIGTTWITNSSISSASRKEAITPPPPIIQMSFPGSSRRRPANFQIGSATKETLGTAGFAEAAAEDVVADLRAESTVGRSHLPRDVVGLSAPQDRVDRLDEGAHSIGAARPWTVQPLHAPVLPGDVAVGARRDGDDDLPVLFHPRSSSRILAETRHQRKRFRNLLSRPAFENHATPPLRADRADPAGRRSGGRRIRGQRREPFTRRPRKAPVAARGVSGALVAEISRRRSRSDRCAESRASRRGSAARSERRGGRSRLPRPLAEPPAGGKAASLAQRGATFRTTTAGRFAAASEACGRS